MIEIFFVIGLFLGGPEPQVRVFDEHWANPRMCMQRAQELNQRAQERREPYMFVCQHIKHTGA